MIQATSIPYVIETYDVYETPLYNDGTPKIGKTRHRKMMTQFPQEAIDRVHSLTDSVRFRRFVNGVPLTGIEWSWLFICFEKKMPYRTAARMRDASNLDSEQWGFYTFDEEQLNLFCRGGAAPDVDVVAFSDTDTALAALRQLRAANLIADLRLVPHKTYLLFATHDFQDHHIRSQ